MTTDREHAGLGLADIKTPASACKPKVRVLQHKPDEAVIEMLEGLLMDARAGKLQSIAAVMSYTDQLTGNAWAGMGKANMAMIGEMRALEADMLNMLIDLRHTTP